jgi:hypothetical protein
VTQLSQNKWKFVSLALALAVLVLLANSRTEPIKADSQDNRFTIVQGMVPQGLSTAMQPSIPTMFRLDAVSGHAMYLGKTQGGVYQWWHITEPLK